MALTSAPTVMGALAGYDDPAARARLRRMKTYAGALLGLAAAVFLATFAMGEGAATGYVRAAAEAGMVGGLADWFAVTALFRHPLRLPIPHTALVPRKKDEIATKLGEFVSGYFLTPEAVIERVGKADPVRRVGELLQERRVADTVGREVARTVAAVMSTIDDTLIAGMVLEHLRRDLHRRSYAREAGRLLTAALANRAQDPIVELGLPRLREQLIANRELARTELKRFVESLGLVARLWATERRVDRMIDKTIDTLAEMAALGRSHPIRRQIDELLARLADGLCTDAVAADTLDDLLRRLADDTAIEAWLAAVVARYLDSARELLGAPTASLEEQLGRFVRDLGERVGRDPAFAARLEAGLEQAVRYVVEHYGDQVVALIRDQVAKWDAADAARRIETAVGRDLQFIRINGTVVGALAGVAIHTVAVLAGHG